MNYAKMTKAELIEELKSLQSLHLSEPVSEKMESVLYESEERYKTLIENAPEAIVVHDVDENCFVELPSSNRRLVRGGISDISERKRVEKELEQHRHSLEELVKERTHELSKENEQMVQEIEERKEAEAQIKDSLAEKEVLLKEIHHRIKNNLQVISSLLELQSSHIKSKQVSELFKESQNQIKSISLVHEHLYQSSDLGKIEFGNYVHSLIEQLIYSYGWKLENMDLKIDIDKLTEVDQAIPCGLIN